jgi:hypothetical protein
MLQDSACAKFNGIVYYCRLGGAMTIIKQGIKMQDMKREVREIREIARKIAVSKASARRFLFSTGMYSANGQIKPQYR